MQRQSATLRKLLAEENFILMPIAYDALSACLAEDLGYKGVYTGGFATGAALATPEPLLTLDEQVRVAGSAASRISIPLIADAGAGFGEPLHTMRTVQEFIRAGVAGIHIEDQIYPKRVHYHKYVAHIISRQEYVDKIRLACRQRDESDSDFVIIARTDAIRTTGFDEAMERINMAAAVGADLGMVFPRDKAEMEAAPKQSKIPLVYPLSRGNRDKRPLPTVSEMTDMGYKVCIDALTGLLASFHFQKKALQEVLKTGKFTSLTAEQCIEARQQIEDLKGLEKFYKIEEETVET